MSAQPPAGPDRLPPPGSLRCPRCSATVGPDQDWCLECGAPARTRLAPTPNWQLPTVAIGAIVLLAGALLAFAFVELTSDDGVVAKTTPTAVLQTVPPAAVPPPAVVPPPVVPTTATSTLPAGTTVPTAVPGQTVTATVPAPATTDRTSTTPLAPRSGSTSAGTPTTSTQPTTKETAP